MKYVNCETPETVQKLRTRKSFENFFSLTGIPNQPNGLRGTLLRSIKIRPCKQFGKRRLRFDSSWAEACHSKRISNISWIGNKWMFPLCLPPKRCKNDCLKKRKTFFGEESTLAWILKFIPMTLVFDSLFSLRVLRSLTYCCNVNQNGSIYAIWYDKTDFTAFKENRLW